MKKMLTVTACAFAAFVGWRMLDEWMQTTPLNEQAPWIVGTALTVTALVWVAPKIAARIASTQRNAS